MFILLEQENRRKTASYLSKVSQKKNKAMHFSFGTYLCRVAKNQITTALNQ